jgi:hypothetical protein
VVNRSRRNGTGDINQLVGDYTNPVLKPEAAEVVKRHGEIMLTGAGYPDPRRYRRQSAWRQCASKVLVENFREPDAGFEKLVLHHWARLRNVILLDIVAALQPVISRLDR